MTDEMRLIKLLATVQQCKICNMMKSDRKEEKMCASYEYMY